MPIQIDYHLYYTPGYFVRPINGLGVSAFDVFFFLALAGWLFRTASDDQTRIRLFGPVTIPYLLIWLLSLAGLVRAEVDVPIAVAVLWAVIKNLLVFLYVANNVNRYGRIKHIAAILLIIGMGQSALGLAQYFTGGKLGLAMFGEAERSYFEMKAGAGFVSRVAGTLGHPNKLAVFLNLLIQMNVALLFASAGFKNRRWLFIPLGVMGTAMLLTYSRGGWLGLALGGSVTLVWCLVRIIRHRTLSVILLLFVALSLALAVVASVPSIRKRLFEDDYGSAALRGPMSLVAANVIRHHPWMGVGLNNYTAVSKRYDISDTGVSYSFPKPVHNEFLLIAAEQGVIVLALFLAILIQMFVCLYRTASTMAPKLIIYLAIGFFGGWLGWCLHHVFEYEYVFFSELTWVLFGLFQAMYVWARHESAKDACACAAQFQ